MFSCLVGKLNHLTHTIQKYTLLSDLNNISRSHYNTLTGRISDDSCCSVSTGCCNCWTK